MDTTADVLLQSVLMNLLDAKSLLCFARCSRRMQSLANSPIAWKHSPLSVSLTVPADEAFFPSPCILPRHARVSLRLLSSSAPTILQFDQLIATLTSIVAPSPLYELIADDHADISVDQWTAILSLAPFATLQVLRLTTFQGKGIVTAEMMEPISRMQQLKALSLCAMFNSPFLVAGLARNPMLQSLQLVDHPYNSYARSVLPHIVPWSRLHELSISLPAIYGRDFKTIFTAPSLQSLQRLIINGFGAAGGFGCESVPLEDYATAFSSLISLRWLVLKRIHEIDVMLPFVLHAPVLESVDIQPRSMSESVSDPLSLPSALLVAELEQARPWLRVRLLPLDDSHLTVLERFQLTFLPIKR